jgi:hypothetical protein
MAVLDTPIDLAYETGITIAATIMIVIARSVTIIATSTKPLSTAIAVLWTISMTLGSILLYEASAVKLLREFVSTPPLTMDPVSLSAFLVTAGLPTLVVHGGVYRERRWVY